MTCASASRVVVDAAADDAVTTPTLAARPPKHHHVPWTKEEDARLQRMQEKYGNKWSTVAGFLPGRTGQQCAQRWRHRVNPNIRRDKWTKEEDDKLAALYDQHGQRWAIIARSLDGRTDQQCMGRWRRHVDPSVARGNWTLEEDEKLTKEHETLRAKWAVIAREIEGRTAQQCRARFYQLKQIQRDEEEEKKKKKKKKTADREENDGEKKEEEKEQQQNQEKKRKKRKMSAEENTDSSNENNNNNNNNNKEKKNKKRINANDAKIVVAKGSFLSEAFPPITASMEQISLLEENDAMKKESLEPIQFNQKMMAMSANVTTTSTKKRKPTNGNENGENKNGNENRSFAQDPSKSITEPSTPEEEAEKPPTARTSRSTKKTTLPTLFSAATKRKPSSATAAPARSNAKGSTTKTAKPKTSRRRTPTNRGRRTVIKNDAFRGNQDDTLTLLCAAADRLEGLFSSTTQRRSF